MPIPEEQGHGKGGVRMRPRRIEIHVDGKRAGPPNRESGKKSPAFFHVLPREAESEE